MQIFALVRVPVTHTYSEPGWVQVHSSGVTHIENYCCNAVLFRAVCATGLSYFVVNCRGKIKATYTNCPI